MKSLMCMMALLLAKTGVAQTLPSSEWTIMQVENRIRIEARDAKAAQTLSVWSRKSLQLLQTQWGMAVPFQANSPVIIRVSPDNVRTELFQRHTPGKLVQVIQIPEEAELQNPLEFADAFTRALLTRILLANRESGEPVPEVPDWLVLGYSHRLLPGASESIYGKWFTAFQQGATVSFPEQIASFPPSSGKDLIKRAESALLCRWLLKEEPRKVNWEWIARHPKPTLQEWVERTPGANDPRELHMAWHVWVASEKLNIISEFKLFEPALELLEERRHVHPALIGIGGFDSRYQPVTLPELIPEVNRIGFDDVMVRWTVRLQPLAFRQGKEFRETTQTYFKAGEHLRQSTTATGRKRRELLQEFNITFEKAESRFHDLMFKAKQEAVSVESFD